MKNKQTNQGEKMRHNIMLFLITFASFSGVQMLRPIISETPLNELGVVYALYVGLAWIGTGFMVALNYRLCLWLSDVREGGK